MPKVKRFAFYFAVNERGKGINPSATHGSIKKLSEILKSKKFGFYDLEPRMNFDLGEHSFLDALRQFIADVNVARNGCKAEILLYLCGHGHSEDGKLYLNTLSGERIDLHKIIPMLQDGLSYNCSKVIIIDCCRKTRDVKDNFDAKNLIDNKEGVTNCCCIYTTSYGELAGCCLETTLFCEKLIEVLEEQASRDQLALDKVCDFIATRITSGNYKVTASLRKSF